MHIRIFDNFFRSFNGIDVWTNNTVGAHIKHFCDISHIGDPNLRTEPTQACDPQHISQLVIAERMMLHIQPYKVIPRCRGNLDNSWVRNNNIEAEDGPVFSGKNIRNTHFFLL